MSFDYESFVAYGCSMSEMHERFRTSLRPDQTAFDLMRVLPIAIWGEGKESDPNILQIAPPECDAFLKRFGPEHSQMVTKVIDNLMDRATFSVLPWFHGRINRQVAEARLHTAAPGGYLLRFSDSIPGTFALSRSYLHQGQQMVRHYVVYNLGSRGYGLKPTFEQCASTEVFKSIPEFIARESTVFCHPIPRGEQIFVGISQHISSIGSALNSSETLNFEDDDWVAGYGAIDDSFIPSDDLTSTVPVPPREGDAVVADTQFHVDCMGGYGCFLGDGKYNNEEFQYVEERDDTRKLQQADQNVWRLHSLIKALAETAPSTNGQGVSGAHAYEAIYSQYDASYSPIETSDTTLADIRIQLCLNEVRLLYQSHDHLNEVHEAFHVTQSLVATLFIWTSANRTIPTSDLDAIFLEAISSLFSFSKHPDKSHLSISKCLLTVVDLFERVPMFGDSLFTPESDLNLFYISQLHEQLGSVIPIRENSTENNLFISNTVMSAVQFEVAKFLCAFATVMKKILPGVTTNPIEEKALRVYLHLMSSIETADENSVDSHIMMCITKTNSMISDTTDARNTNMMSGRDICTHLIAPYCIDALEVYMSLDVDFRYHAACSDKLRYLELVYSSTSSLTISSPYDYSSTKSSIQLGLCELAGQLLDSIYGNDAILNEQSKAKEYLREGQSYLENRDLSESVNKAYIAFRRSLTVARRHRALEDEIAGLASLSALLGSNRIVDVIRRNVSYDSGSTDVDISLNKMHQRNQLFECTYYLRQFIVLSSLVQDRNTKSGGVQSLDASNLLLQGAYFLSKCYISLGWKSRAEKLIRNSMSASHQVSNKAKFMQLLNQLGL